MRTSGLVAASLAVAVVLGGTACGDERAPVRVGVLLECSGFLVGARDSVQAAASLPLLERGGRRAGEGVTGAVGVAARSDGSWQVTYDGRPLYYWKDDKAAGDTAGQGVGDVWYVAQVDGSVPTE